MGRDGSKHVHSVDRNNIEISIDKIAQYPDTFCLDHIAEVFIEEDGEIYLSATDPFDFGRNIPKRVWNGSVQTLSFDEGAFPIDIAEWLRDRIDLIETVCSGMYVYWNERSNQVGVLSEAAQAALCRLQEEAFCDIRRISRLLFEDYIALDYPAEFYALKTPQEIRKWVTEVVNNGEHFYDEDGNLIIIDVNEAFAQALSDWEYYHETQ